MQSGVKVNAKRENLTERRGNGEESSCLQTSHGLGITESGAGRMGDMMISKSVHSFSSIVESWEFGNAYDAGRVFDVTHATSQYKAVPSAASDSAGVATTQLGELDNVTHTTAQFKAEPSAASVSVDVAAPSESSNVNHTTSRSKAGPSEYGSLPGQGEASIEITTRADAAAESSKDSRVFVIKADSTADDKAQKIIASLKSEMKVVVKDEAFVSTVVGEANSVNAARVATAVQVATDIHVAVAVQTKVAGPLTDVARVTATKAWFKIEAEAAAVLVNAVVVTNAIQRYRWYECYDDYNGCGFGFRQRDVMRIWKCAEEGHGQLVVHLDHLEISGKAVVVRW